MSIRRDIHRSEYFQSLSLDKKTEYFNADQSKFLPAIDNIYYSLFIRHDFKGEHPALAPLFDHLDTLKQKAREEHQEQPLTDTLHTQHRHPQNSHSNPLYGPLDTRSRGNGTTVL